MDERRQRVEQLDAFVRHRLRLYRQAQEHLQRQTINKTVQSIYISHFLFHIYFSQID
jgi:hypothetical protein